MALDRLQGFARRLDRRLGETQAGAGQVFLGIEQRMGKSGARYRAQLEELQRQVIRAMNFALGEAQGLPGDPELREDAPTIKTKLDDFAASLFRMKWFSEMPVTLVNAANASVHRMIAGDVEDYEGGVWHPRDPNEAAITTEPAAEPPKHFGFAEAGGAGFGQAPFNPGQEAGTPLPLSAEATEGMAPEADAVAHIEGRTTLEARATVVPASDRLVPLDHNSPAYRDLIDAVDRLYEAVRGENGFASEEEKRQAEAEIAASRTLLALPAARETALQAVLGGAALWLGRRFEGVLLGVFASAVWSLLQQVITGH